MTHRKTPCDVCNSKLIDSNTTNNITGDVVYEERCAVCGNLLYGWVKKNEPSNYLPF